MTFIKRFESAITSGSARRSVSAWYDLLIPSRRLIMAPSIAMPRSVFIREWALILILTVALALTFLVDNENDEGVKASDLKFVRLERYTTINDAI